MASQNRPASPKHAPDPATSYERARPENEAGMGQLDMEDVIPEDRPDRGTDATPNKHDPRQINALDLDNQRGSEDAGRDSNRKNNNPDG
jgi:hypothetical protein